MPTLVAIASLCLLIQAISLAHLLLVRHEVCPVHGEVRHGSAGHAGGDEAASSVGPGDQAAVARPGVAPEQHDDDHCQVLTERRDVPRPSSHCLHAALANEVPLPAVAAPAPPRRLALYRVAPKNSPPHAA